MEESGIDLGFDLASLCAEEFKTDQLQQILDDGMHYQRNQDLMYYELKSKTVPTNDSPPTFKTLTPTSRTQLKQQLMREHAQEQCRRESLQLQVQSQLNSKPRRPEVLPIPAPSTHHAVDLPPQVLQVRTMLDNPTRYHVIEKQRSQVRQYLSESFQPRQLSSECASTSVLSAPDLLTAPSPDYDAFTSGSGIFSPGLCSGTTSNSETDELLDDIMSLESRETAGSSGLALSCDADVKQETLPATDADIHALQKDRQKKDNHNMIERRRRFNINDRIKELGTLLPKTNDPFYEVVRDARPNKGTILKSSVDYIKCLKDEINKMKQNEYRRKQVEINNKKLLFRIKELEQQARRHGLPVSEFVWQPSQADNHPHHQTTQPDSHHHHHHTAESPHPPYSTPVSVSPSHLHAPPHAAPPPLEPHHHHQQYLSAPSLGCLTLEAPQGLPSLPASYLDHPIKLSMSPTPAMMISGDDHSAPDSTTVLSLTQIEDLMEDDAHNPVQGDPMLCSSPSSRLGVCLVDEEQPTMASILAEDNHMLNIDSSTGGGNPLLGDPSPHSLGLGLLSNSGLLGPPSGMLRGRSSHISDCFSDTDMDIGA